MRPCDARPRAHAAPHTHARTCTPAPRPAAQNYCASKAQGISSQGDADEAESWSFLSLLFEGDGRRELLKRLGFGDVVAAQAAAAAHANGDAAAAGMEHLRLGADGE